MKVISSSFEWAPGPHVLLASDRAEARRSATRLFNDLLPQSVLYPVHRAPGQSTVNGGDMRLRYELDWGNDCHYSRNEGSMRELYKSEEAVVITTMNPSVIDCLYFETQADVVQRLLFSRIEQVFLLEEEEANRFYDDYKAGIQHVSEILRTQGLW